MMCVKGMIFTALLITGVSPQRTPGPTWNQDPKTGKSYAVLPTTTLKHRTNEELCLKHNSILPEPRTESENTFINKLYPSMFPLGINDFSTEGTWVFDSDGTPLNFTKWHTGAPNGERLENCALMKRKYQKGYEHWGDYSCEDPGTFDKQDINAVCQYDTDTATFCGRCSQECHYTPKTTDADSLAYHTRVLTCECDEFTLMMDDNRTCQRWVFVKETGFEYAIGKQPRRAGTDHCSNPQVNASLFIPKKNYAKFVINKFRRKCANFPCLFWLGVARSAGKTEWVNYASRQPVPTDFLEGHPKAGDRRALIVLNSSTDDNDKWTGRNIFEDTDGFVLCQRDADECATSCQGPGYKSCVNTHGSYICTCAQGYQKTGTTSGGDCIDIDECAGQNHSCHQQCVNTLGSYRCECYSGFKFDLVQKEICIDIDECVTLTQKCELNCTNTPGSFYCVCLPGFHDDNFVCKDTDECSTKNGGCDHLCSNSVGSFECACRLGFIMDTDQSTCLGPVEELCETNDTKYRCACSRGLRITRVRATGKVFCYDCFNVNTPLYILLFSGFVVVVSSVIFDAYRQPKLRGSDVTPSQQTTGTTEIETEETDSTQLEAESSVYPHTMSDNEDTYTYATSVVSGASRRRSLFDTDEDDTDDTPSSFLSKFSAKRVARYMGKRYRKIKRKINEI